MRLGAGVEQELVAAVALVVLADAAGGLGQRGQRSAGSRGWARAPTAPGRGPSSRCGAAGRGCGGSRPGRRRRRSRRRRRRPPALPRRGWPRRAATRGARRTTSPAASPASSSAAAGSAGSSVGGGPAIRSRGVTHAPDGATATSRPPPIVRREGMSVHGCWVRHGRSHPSPPHGATDAPADE